jgi:hypothetical protein
MKRSKARESVPEHIDCMKKCMSPIITAEGKEVAVWELSVPANDSLLSDWAKCFREHYCLDSEIDALRAGTGLSRKDYLTNIIFPDKSIKPGPSIRAGDFAEILINDYLEYVVGYWVPREKYAEKATRDESMRWLRLVGQCRPFLKWAPGGLLTRRRSAVSSDDHHRPGQASGHQAPDAVGSGCRTSDSASAPDGQH